MNYSVRASGSTALATERANGVGRSRSDRLSSQLCSISHSDARLNRCSIWNSDRLASLYDSLLEGDGFEPSVPHKKQPFLAAPVRFRHSPSATKTGSFVPGTDGSNPSPSSGESAANLTSSPCRKAISLRRRGKCISTALFDDLVGEGEN